MNYRLPAVLSASDDFHNIKNAFLGALVRERRGFFVCPFVITLLYVSLLSVMRKQRYIEWPDTWDELTEADWRELLRIRQAVADGRKELTYTDVTTETARAMLKNRGIGLRLADERYVRLVGELAGRLQWLWHVDDGALTLVYRDTRNLMPRIRQWIGPASHGADLVFGEFRMAVALMTDYERNPHEQLLQTLAGLLYRPEATRAQRHGTQLRRQPYDWDDTPQYLERGRQMKPWQTWGVYAWMAWFCQYLSAGTFVIEGEEVSFAPLFGHGGGDKRKGGGGLTQIALTLAETRVFGTLSEVDHTPLLLVMQKLLTDWHTLQAMKQKQPRI